MPTFILTWNPDRFRLDTSRYDELVGSTERGETVL
jgi:hypothetical protein